MAGTGRVSVTKATAIGINQYDVTVKFDIALDWGGYNNYGAYYEVWCNGTYQTGTATFSIPSGGGSWVWATLGSKTFRVTMPKSGSSLTVKLNGYTNTGITPSSISATGSYTLPARTWLWTVSYNANGGTGAPSSQTKTSGQTLKLSSTKPTRTGYIFQGWATSSSGAVAYQPGASYTTNAALTLYAVWKAETYTVSYDANGGTGAPANQLKHYGLTLTLASMKPTRTNYNFLGWTTAASSTTINYSPGDTYTDNKPITLYAVWELAYTPPRISDLSVDRCTANGTLSDEGTYARIAFKWATDKNIQGVTISGKDVTNGTDAFETEEGGTGTAGSVDIIVGGWPNDPLDIDHEYSVEISVNDAQGYTKVSRIIPPLDYIIDFLAGGGGVAIGRPATLKDTLEVDYKGKFNSGIDVSGTSHFNSDIMDRYGTRINNGLSKYTGSGSAAIDPNTTVDELILTDKNAPTDAMYYIQTVFYSTKSSTANRGQYAIPYNGDGSMYHRIYNGGSWSQWRRHVNSDEMGDYVVETGITPDTYHYAKWNSGWVDLWFQGMISTAGYLTCKLPSFVKSMVMAVCTSVYMPSSSGANYAAMSLSVSSLNASNNNVVIYGRTTNNGALPNVAGRFFCYMKCKWK